VRRVVPPPSAEAAPPILLPQPEEESSPTVITSARARGGPDAKHAESFVGRKLGHYELIESVGVGGMGAVIKALDEDLGRIVALKILPPDMATDPENITRFKQEARAAARLDHENIARVYSVGEDQGLHFIAFEYVEGENLRVRMEKKGGLLPVGEALHYFIQVTAGLSHAAARGVVHRDIKPSNIVVTPDGRAKIVDMGLARNLDQRASNGQLTHSGVTLGTFDYISPEQAIEPRSADIRSDIYSLGCTFYHILTGRTPVPDGTAAKKLHCHQHVPPLDPREINPAIPDELAAVLGRMMAKDPAARYQHPDHLLQHLLIIADKLKLPNVALGDSTHAISPYVDAPMPAPPTLSAWWIGGIVCVLVVGLIALTGGFNGSPPPLDSTPFWQNGPNDSPQVSTKAKDQGIPIAPAQVPADLKGPREARNTAELVSLLKRGATHIRLRPGTVYDLTRSSRKELDPPEALFEGSDLLIECDRLIDKPTIRMAALPADDARAVRAGSMTLRGPADGNGTSLHLRGIRFELVAPEPAVDQIGLSIANFDRVDVEECTFIPPSQRGMPEDGPAMVGIRQDYPQETLPSARFERCWFAPGCVSLLMQKGHCQTTRLAECAFGPQFAVVRVEPTLSAGENPSVNEVTLESCTVLMTQGAIVEVGDLVPCHVTAGMCLFSNPELAENESSRAFLIRQVGIISPATRFEGMKLADAPAAATANGYHQLLAYANGDLACAFEDCKQEQIPVEDAAGRMLTKHPWADEQPIKRIIDSPRQVKQAIAVDLKQEILRLEPDRNRHLLGTKYLPGARVYDLFPLESPVPDVKQAGNIKVWHPEFPGRDDKLPAGVYRSLDKALLDMAKGDTLLIRHNGLLEVDPIEFKKADTELTIRADEGHRPILMPRVPTLKKEGALFKLFGGQLTLEGLRFRLKADRAPAVVSLPGGGQCTFRDCSATLEEGDDLALVSLADPRGEMMMMGAVAPEKWPTPRIAIENSFVRGRGRALTVHASRSFDLRVKGCLVVLNGSLIGVEPTTVDMGDVVGSQVTLDRVTAYLTRPLLSERAADKKPEGKGHGLVPVQIQATACLFVPAAESVPLVSLEHVDTLDQADNLVQWRDGKGNLYAFKPDQVLLHVMPENTDNAALIERIVPERWLARWKEADAAFADVNFSVVPATKRFDGVKLGDFDVKSIVPAPKTDSPVGAPIELLRRTFIDE